MEFYNRWPVVLLLYRTGQLLNIRGECVPETTLYNAILKSVADFSGKVSGITDFTCCESVFLDRHPKYQDKGRTSPYYVLFVELIDDDGEKDCSKNQIAELSAVVFLSTSLQNTTIMTFMHIPGRKKFVRSSSTVQISKRQWRFVTAEVVRGQIWSFSKTPIVSAETLHRITSTSTNYCARNEKQLHCAFRSIDGTAVFPFVPGETTTRSQEAGTCAFHVGGIRTLLTNY